MQVEHIVEVLETIAPLQHAADWDNVGLLVGSPRWEAGCVLLTIDLTGAVLREAVDCGVGMIVSYHPPIFEPLPRLTDAEPKQQIVLLREVRDDQALELRGNVFRHAGIL